MLAIVLNDHEFYHSLVLFVLGAFISVRKSQAGCLSPKSLTSPFMPTKVSVLGG